MSGLFNLNDKVALVTGASRGIGKAIAQQLAAAGATVIGTATSESGASAISEYLGGKGKGFALNVTSQDSVDALFAAIKEQFGGVDILVNNAGITRDNLMMRMKDEEWDDIINTNLSSLYKLSKAVMRPMMKNRSGRIISIGSVVGSMGNAGQVNYATAKAGLLGFTKSLAKEVASRGITVNAVAPGFIDTDMTQTLSDEQKEAIFSQVPANRLGKPEEIASVVVFLASDAAAYINGETIHVNGGMYMA
ncbi:3-oxoacyl-ACP reductase FabG [Thalassotalea mangrovi]|uniref:3-oxoacyl-[acyl-carrier-protein] reductase n=1 Tax=Thalassotalea mangrovi TaxID=2572245 RepID=A0A4U1B6C3_9GAMM|nr:3-oxoacyl-ACP reductase FabG [Thalassotalea mangrovi]TKB45976.1 3-oxoacyl-ACP reductase FabG [Thalassotalea mangrovi]